MTTVADVFEIARDPEDRQVADAIVLQECGPQLLQVFRATVRPQLLLTDGVVRSWRELRDRTGLPKEICKAVIAADCYGMGARRLQQLIQRSGATAQEEALATSRTVRDMLPTIQFMEHARERGIIVRPEELARLRLEVSE